MVGVFAVFCRFFFAENFWRFLLSILFVENFVEIFRRKVLSKMFVENFRQKVSSNIFVKKQTLRWLLSVKVPMKFLLATRGIIFWIACIGCQNLLRIAYFFIWQLIQTQNLGVLYLKKCSPLPSMKFLTQIIWTRFCGWNFPTTYQIIF